MNGDNVQLENGYTPIAHEILERLAQIRLSPTQYRIVLIVWRYTYGFNRKEHTFSLSFLENALHCDKRNIQRELKDLVHRKVLNQKIDKHKRVLGFNKHYSQWIYEFSIGEIDNGELDNGNLDDCQNDRGGIGEIAGGSLAKSPTKKNNIKTNIKNIYTPEFENWYSDYPNPEDKMRTFKNFKKCLKENTLEELIRAKDNYKAKVKAEGREKQYIKTSANFLGRDKFYRDYINVQNKSDPKELSRRITQNSLAKRRGYIEPTPAS